MVNLKIKKKLSQFNSLKIIDDIIQLLTNKY